MHKLVFLVVMAAVALSSSDWGLAARADEGSAVAHKRARRVCTGPDCGPYAPCGARCRVVCPDGYSCHPLYDAYGPYHDAGRGLAVRRGPRNSASGAETSR
jgi:hypothetical protein